jgi:hypothetical protein
MVLSDSRSLHKVAFQMMIMLLFGHIDADRDGVLTEAELTNHRPPHRDR